MTLPVPTHPPESWIETHQDWLSTFESLVRDLARIRHLLDNEDVSLVRTALSLREAEAATTGRGLSSASAHDVIMRRVARATDDGDRLPQQYQMIGASYFYLARFFSACDPDYAISKEGLEEIMERSFVKSATDTQAFEKLPTSRKIGDINRRNPPPLLETLKRLRWIWHRLKDHEIPGIIAGRFSTAAALAPNVGHQVLFFGPALGPAEQRLLLQACGDDDSWLNLVVPLLAKASRDTYLIINRLIARKDEWTFRLSKKWDPEESSRPTGLEAPSFLRALFAQPYLSSNDMARVTADIDRKAPAIRTAQNNLLRLGEVNAVRRRGNSQIWEATESAMIGKIYRTT